MRPSSTTSASSSSLARLAPREHQPRAAARSRSPRTAAQARGGADGWCGLARDEDTVSDGWGTHIFRATPTSRGIVEAMQGHTVKRRRTRAAKLAVVVATMLWGPVLLAQPGQPPVPPRLMVFTFEEGPFIDEGPGFLFSPDNDGSVSRGTETQVVTCVRAEHALRCHIEVQSVLPLSHLPHSACLVEEWALDIAMRWHPATSSWRAFVPSNLEPAPEGWTRIVTLQPAQAGRWRLRHAWLPTHGICVEPSAPSPGQPLSCRPLVMDFNQTNDFRQTEPGPSSTVFATTPIPQGCRRLQFGARDHSRSVR
jgi:hypothetical protein